MGKSKISISSTKAHWRAKQNLSRGGVCSICMGIFDLDHVKTALSLVGALFSNLGCRALTRKWFVVERNGPKFGPREHLKYTHRYFWPENVRIILGSCGALISKSSGGNLKMGWSYSMRMGTLDLKILRPFGGHSVHFFQSSASTRKHLIVERNGRQFGPLSLLGLYVHVLCMRVIFISHMSMSFAVIRCTCLCCSFYVLPSSEVLLTESAGLFI